MGCCNSRHDQTDSEFEPKYVDIPLINRPRKNTVHESYYTASSYRSVPQKKKTPCIIDYSAYEYVPEPEQDTAKQQKFTDYFSHIETGTFQTMSVHSHIPSPQVQKQDYTPFMDTVLDTLVPPLLEMKVSTPESLVIDLSSSRSQMY